MTFCFRYKMLLIRQFPHAQILGHGRVVDGYQKIRYHLTAAYGIGGRNSLYKVNFWKFLFLFLVCNLIDHLTLAFKFPLRSNKKIYLHFWKSNFISSKFLKVKNVVREFLQLVEFLIVDKLSWSIRQVEWLILKIILSVQNKWYHRNFKLFLFRTTKRWITWVFI